MRKLVLLLLLAQTFYFFAGARPIEAEGVFKISGKVVDTNGDPLIGAVIMVENSLLGTSTSLNGTYLISIRKPDEYVLTASYMGYKKESLTIFVDSDRQANFTLSSESIMSEAVIVNATRASSKMPIAQTNINSDELEQKKSGFDIPYLLELIPSVVAISEGGTGVGNTSFRVRGTDMTRINITVNGIPMNDPESQGVWWVNMPDFVNSVENIQIQRGVGTSTHGAGAFGGTVNFQTKTLSPEPFAKGEFMAGSFNTFRTSVMAGTGLLNDRFSFETRYSKITSDGYIDRGWSDHESLFFTGAWHTSNSILRFNLIHGVQHTGITWEGNPGYMVDSIRTYNSAGFMGIDELGKPMYYPNESDNYTQTHYQLTYSHQVNNQLSFNLAGYWVDGEGFYEQYKRNHKLSNYGINPITIGDTTISRTDIIRQKWLDNDLFGFTSSVTYNTNPLSIILGGGWSHYDNDHFGNVLWTEINNAIPKDHNWYLNSGKKADYNIFLKSIYQIEGGLALFADIQYRGISYDLSGSDDDLQALDQSHKWDFFNPKAGVFYTISPLQEAFFSVGVAHREPTRADIKDAMKYGSNQTPKEEMLIDYEMGYNLKSRLFALGVNLYYMDYKDQLVLTGKLSDVGYPLMTNVKNSYRTGVEIMAGVMPTTWFRWDANLTLSQNRIRNFVEYVDVYDQDWNLLRQNEYELGDTDISFSPSVVASSIVRVEPAKNVVLSLTTKYVGSQYIDNTSNSERILDAYLVNNLIVDYKLNLKGAKQINFQLMVNNLMNNKYIGNGWVWRALFELEPEVIEGIETPVYDHYREDGFFPQAGINFMGKIVLDF